jgi:hypothetical protein
MGIEACVRLVDQPAAEALLAPAGLVSTAQDDGRTRRVEGERESPHAVGRMNRNSFMFA